MSSVARANGAPPRRQPSRRRHLTPVSERPESALRQVVDGMPDEYIQCRDFGHSWQPFTARPADGGSYESVLRCARCKTTRSRLIGARGQVLSTSYDHPDGYLVAGLGRLTGTDRDMLRLASVTRLIDNWRAVGWRAPDA